MEIWNTIPNLSKGTAVAMGLFDGVHIGHQKVIKTAIQSGYLPTVFTFSIEKQLPTRKEGLLLLSADNVKYELMENLGVEVVVEPPFEDIKRISADDFVNDYLVKKLGAKLVVCGENFRFGKNAAGDSALLQELASKAGIEVKIVTSTMYDGGLISSSRIREALINGDLYTARAQLGYDYFWEYKVVSGNKNGRKIGYPTINQNFPVGYIVPKRGAYASKVWVDGRKYVGVTNIGVRPSISKLESPIAETYIIDYDGKALYGEYIRVSINKYLREERKFESIEQLKQGIYESVEQSKHINSLLD